MIVIERPAKVWRSLFSWIFDCIAPILAGQRLTPSAPVRTLQFRRHCPELGPSGCLGPVDVRPLHCSCHLLAGRASWGAIASHAPESSFRYRLPAKTFAFRFGLAPVLCLPSPHQAKPFGQCLSPPKLQARQATCCEVHALSLALPMTWPGRQPLAASVLPWSASDHAARACSARLQAGSTGLAARLHLPSNEAFPQADACRQNCLPYPGIRALSST